MKDSIDLEKITKAVYSFLDEQGFEFRNYGSRCKFSEKGKDFLRIRDVYLIGDARKDYADAKGYEVVIAPKDSGMDYDWSPNDKGIKISVSHNLGIYICNSNDKLLIEEQKIQTIVFKF